MRDEKKKKKFAWERSKQPGDEDRCEKLSAACIKLVCDVHPHTSIKGGFELRLLNVAPAESSNMRQLRGKQREPADMSAARNSSRSSADHWNDKVDR